MLTERHGRTMGSTKNYTTIPDFASRSSVFSAPRPTVAVRP